MILDNNVKGQKYYHHKDHSHDHHSHAGLDAPEISVKQSGSRDGASDTEPGVGPSGRRSGE